MCGVSVLKTLRKVNGSLGLYTYQAFSQISHKCESCLHQMLGSNTIFPEIWRFISFTIFSELQSYIKCIFIDASIADLKKLREIKCLFNQILNF